MSESRVPLPNANAKDRKELEREVQRVLPGFDHDAMVARANTLTRDAAGADHVARSLADHLLTLTADQRGSIRSWDLYVATCIRNFAIKWREAHRSALRASQPANEPVFEDSADLFGGETEINATLAQLPKTCQEVFAYFFAQACAPEEIAERLGISVEAVQKHLRHALSELSELRASRGGGGSR